MTTAFSHLIAIALMMNTVAVSPHEWVNAYAARGGKATYNEQTGLLSIAPNNDISLDSAFYPKAVAEVALVGDGVRNKHVSAVLKWSGTNILYMPECTGIDDTIFPIIKASGLHEIHIHDAYVTALGVSQLSGAKSIRKIDISTREEGKTEDLKLTDMHQLKSLSLLNFNIKSIVLSDMKKLETMFDSSDLIDPKHLRQVEFSKLPMLSSANFSRSPIDKLMVEECNVLTDLWVKKAKLSDSDVAALARKNPKLKIVQK